MGGEWKWVKEQWREWAHVRVPRSIYRAGPCAKKQLINIRHKLIVVARR